MLLTKTAAINCAATTAYRIKTRTMIDLAFYRQKKLVKTEHTQKIMEIVIKMISLLFLNLFLIHALFCSAAAPRNYRATTLVGNFSTRTETKHKKIALCECPQIVNFFFVLCLVCLIVVCAARAIRLTQKPSEKLYTR